MKKALVVIACLLFVAASRPALPAAAQSLPPNWYVLHLLAVPEHPPAIYIVLRHPTEGAASVWGIFKSSDGGETWPRVAARGLDDVDPPQAFAVDYRHPATFYLSGETRTDRKSWLFRSTNSGLDWTAFGSPIDSYLGITALAVDARDPNTLYAGRYVSCYGNCGEFVVSRDGGATWQPFDRTVEAGRPRSAVRSIVVDPQNDDVLWAETVYSYRMLSVVHLRGDRNGNWTAIPKPPAATGHSPAGLVRDPASGALYTGSFRAGALNPAAEDYRLWRSPNPGAPDVGSIAWQAVARWTMGIWGWYGSTELVRPLAIGAPGATLYVRTISADTALWKTTDEGLSWRQIRLPPPPEMPATEPGRGWTAPTGHEVSGSWLDFLKRHGDTDNLGYPRTPVLRDPMMGGQTVQYFQRLILEWHPENPPAHRVQRRLLGDMLYPGADLPLPASDAPPRPYVYFPFTPGRITGLGHFVANRTRSGQMVYFLDYFNSHGGVDSFGFPKEEPVLRNGLWTQRFQAAVFEYHPEFDIDGTIPGTSILYRSYRVMLELLGDKYIQQNRLPYQ